jgi:L-amino acid N-acyltransferase YncA
MADPNPFKARIGRAEKRKQALQPIVEALNEAIEAARAVLSDDDPSMRLRAAHAISQVGATYVRVYEAAEIESRIEALEQQQHQAANLN